MADRPETQTEREADLHRLLTAERARTADLIASLSGNVTSILEATRSTATDDEHDPEGSTIAFERSQASSMLAAAERQLAELDLALARIAAGTYGPCERCGAPIPQERLLARPTARTCVPCASRR